MFRIEDEEEKAMALIATHLYKDVMENKDSAMVLVNSSRKAPFLIMYVRDSSGDPENEFVIIVHGGNHDERVDYAKAFVKGVKQSLTLLGLEYNESLPLCRRDDESDEDKLRLN